MKFIQYVDRFFGIRQSGSSFALETRAGLTTFVTMAYILFVNPSILSQAISIPSPNLTAQLLTTTALAAAIGTWLMAFIARYPFALAPGMGTNAYFAFSVVLGMHVPWQTALGAVFISGILFILLSLFRIREMVVRIFPESLRHATTAGIGFFLALLGLENAGLIVKHETTLVSMGNITTPNCIVSLFGLLLTTILLVRKVRGAIFIGIAATTLFAILGKFPIFDGQVFRGLPTSFIQAPQWPKDLLFAMDLRGSLELGILGIVFVFLFVDFFDTAGTLIALSQSTNFDKTGQGLKRTTQAFLADAIATTIGAALGTSTTTCFMESAAGVEDGGKTGFTAFVVGVLFFLSIFFWPMLALVPKVSTAPALILIGFMMVACVRLIPWDDWQSAIPAFLTLFLIPMSFSIANGISFGILSYVLIRLFTGKIRETPFLLYLIAVLLILRFVYLS